MKARVEQVMKLVDLWIEMTYLIVLDENDLTEGEANASALPKEIKG